MNNFQVPNHTNNIQESVLNNIFYVENTIDKLQVLKLTNNFQVSESHE